MFVLCPHCQFLVGLDPVSGQPPTQCPRCKAALQASVLQPAQPLDGDRSPTPLDEVQAVPGTSTGVDEDPSLSGESEDIVPITVAEAPTDDIAPVMQQHPAASAPKARPRPRGRLPFPRTAPRWLRATIIPFLLALLLLQSLLADRARLAADAHWRPMVVAFCSLLHCQVPPWREPSAFALLDRNVRADPRRPKVLLATATFRNDAQWAQPWPSLLLTLSDADGRIAGRRLFTPGEYLGTRPTQNGLGSGQTASVALAILEPTRQSVAFTFELR